MQKVSASLASGKNKKFRELLLFMTLRLIVGEILY